MNELGLLGKAFTQLHPRYVVLEMISIDAKELLFSLAAQKQSSVASLDYHNLRLQAVLRHVDDSVFLLSYLACSCRLVPYHNIKEM